MGRQGFGKTNGKGGQSGAASNASEIPGGAGGGVAVKQRAETTQSAELRRPGKAVALTHEQIAERAKALWQQHGCPAGEDEKNWYEAEAQLKHELGIG